MRGKWYNPDRHYQVGINKLAEGPVSMLYNSESIKVKSSMTIKIGRNFMKGLVFIWLILVCLIYRQCVGSA